MHWINNQYSHNNWLMDRAMSDWDFPGLDNLMNRHGPDGMSTEQGFEDLLDGMFRFDAKSGCRCYPAGLLPETREAMDTLTDEEIAQLKIWRDSRTSEFVCIGFEWNGKATKWADERRALAIAAMEKQIKWEERNAW